MASASRSISVESSESGTLKRLFLTRECGVLAALACIFALFALASPVFMTSELIAKLKNHSNRPRSLGQILPKFAGSDIH